jgi:succinoglycan biosynthesis transport protein ExoP
MEESTVKGQDAALPDPDNNPKPNGNGKPVAGRIEPTRRNRASDPHLNAAPSALASAPDVGSYLQALKRRWITAAAVGGTLAIVASLGAWFLLSPKYIAAGRIRVAYEDPRFMNDLGSGGHGDFLTYLKTQAEHLTGRRVISAALKKNEDLKRLNLEARTGKDPAEYIEGEIKVEYKDNELLTLVMKSTDPQVSLIIVKAVMEAYMDEIVYAERMERVDKIANWKKALEDATTELKRKQASLDKTLKDAGGKDPATFMLRMGELQASIRDANHQRGDLRLKIKQEEAEVASLRSRIDSIKEGGSTGPALTAILKSDPLIQQLKAEMKRDQETIDDFEEKAPGVPYPSLLSARSRINRAKTKIAQRRKELQAEVASAMDAGNPGHEELEHLRQARLNAIEAMRQYIKDLDKDLQQFNAELANMKQTDHAELDRLKENIKHEEEFVRQLALRLKKEEVELNAGQRVTVAQEAELQKKDMKIQILGVIAAPVLALLGTCMGLAWLDVRQRRIRSAGEVSRGLGIRVVGAVPSVPNLERHLMGPTGEPDLEGHPALESIDALRTMLLRDADDEATRVVMVTSATHGEGKTTVASHLASSLARAGRKTLLIDGDLRRPSAHQLFELPMQPGFSEVLLDEVELNDAVQPTTLDGLSFMAAGQWDREVMQALARGGVEGILEKLQEEYDFIVIDSHPVLPATDSLLIGQRADAVILSVLREVSQMPRVYAASQRLTTLGIRVLGAVVNGADPEEALAATASARMVAH